MTATTTTTAGRVLDGDVADLFAKLTATADVLAGRTHRLGEHARQADDVIAAAVQHARAAVAAYLRLPVEVAEQRPIVGVGLTGREVLTAQIECLSRHLASVSEAITGADIAALLAHGEAIAARFGSGWEPAASDPEPAVVVRPSRRVWAVLALAIAAAATAAVLAVDTASTPGAVATYRQAGDPADTASPTTPPAVAAKAAEWVRALGEAATSTVDLCATAQFAPDARWPLAESRRRYVAAGGDPRCLPPLPWQGSLNPDGIAACEAYRVAYPADPAFTDLGAVCDRWPAPTPTASTRGGLLAAAESWAGGQP